MFFRRKPVTLASLDERLSAVEIALQLREEPPLSRPSGPLDAALAKLQTAILRDANKPS